MTKQLLKSLIIIVCGILLPLLLITPSIFSSGQRDIGTIENIHGIPFPKQDNSFYITEVMAHADIFLKEPVFPKLLKLTVTFSPGSTQSIDVGVRENLFWLSYEKINFYQASQNNSLSEITKTITIPLTDKLQEKDRSIDLMFFANSNNKAYDADKPTTDNTHWILHDIQAKVISTKPTNLQIKDYIKSIIQKERPA
jgi:hypothetical protein